MSPSGTKQSLEMLTRVSNYVNNVLDEEAEPSSALGQFLMNTLSLAPKVEAEDIEKDLYVSCQRYSKKRKLTWLQQQPHPGCPPRLLPRQHYPYSDRPFQPTSHRHPQSRRPHRREEARPKSWPERPARATVGRCPLAPLAAACRAGP